MVISVKADAFGKIIVTRSNDTPITGVATGSTTAAKGETGTLQIAWGTLCDGINIVVDATSTLAGDCAYNGTADLKIGIDKDNNGLLNSTGDEFLTFQIRLQNTMGILDTHIDGCSDASINDPLCGFGVLPGDEKVYVVGDQLRYITGYPTGNGINYTGLRLYFIEGPEPFDPLFFSTFPMTRANGAVDLPTSGSGDDISLDKDIVDGLINGARYYFLAATVDEAKNEGFYSHQPSLGQQHSAKPDEVFGLLSDDFQCLVATAAYGTPMMKEVVTLRRFRGYLLENYRAISFPIIKFYYKISPPLAQFIAQHESLRSLSRFLLWPAVLFAKSSLTRGLPMTLFISFLPLLLTGFFIQLFYRRRNNS